MTTPAAPQTNGTWRSNLLSGYTVVVILLAAVWAFSLLGPMSSAIEENQREGLVSVARAASVAIETSTLPVDEVIDRVASDDGLRLTLVSQTGEVLAESTDAGMTNHASRPEVIAALSGDVGYDRRVSETDGIEYLYAAIPCEYEGSTCVLRVSVPVSKAHADLARLRWTSIMLLVTTTILAAGTSWLLADRAAAPVSRLERVRTDFVANASHELKTPVAGIRLLSESIERASKDGDVDIIPVFTERLNKESQRLQNLVTELLDLSRLENGGLGGRNKETCDLASVVSTSYETHVGKARLKGLEFVYDDGVGSDELCRVNLPPADASLLVDNLLDNAINYTDEGTVEVSLSCTDSKATLSVRDTGIGIPTADQERIFERFYRVDKGHSREMGGTGLGLSLVRHAVERAKGVITLDSTLGKGSTFTVILPKA